MSPTHDNTRRDHAAERFRAAGLPFTVQRRLIWDLLAERTDHPSADAIFAAIVEVLPGLSRATVYRTLETFVALGLVQRLGHPGSAVRYDPKTERHHHLICDACGVVVDIDSAELDGLELPRVRRTGFAVRDFSVQIAGLCRDCQ